MSNINDKYVIRTIPVINTAKMSLVNGYRVKCSSYKRMGEREGA